jgi:defect-in-organelle-trafficking protein DotA
MSFIFTQGVQILGQPGVNPIVALANMGTYYINFAGQVWLMLIQMSIVSSLIMPFGIFIFALISLAMPLLLAWIGIMVMVGFTTAYYVPVLPYIIFTFGSIAWLIAVIEAMVAAPIVALGITHPEGHEAFGKGEHAIMILMNVFLRPALMIIGYIAAISLSYVGVWIINAGFDNAIGFIQGSSQFGTQASGSTSMVPSGQMEPITNPFSNSTTNTITTSAGPISGGYTSWAGIFAFFFSILIYTSLYLTMVQKAFTLIAVLPDRVLRWMGGQTEQIGQEAVQWGEEAHKRVDQGAEKTQEAQGAMDKQLTGYAEKGLGKGKQAAAMGSGGKVSAKGSTGPSSTPEKPES